MAFHVDRDLANQLNLVQVTKEFISVEWNHYLGHFLMLVNSCKLGKSTGKSSFMRQGKIIFNWIHDESPLVIDLTYIAILHRDVYRGGQPGISPWAEFPPLDISHFIKKLSQK